MSMRVVSATSSFWLLPFRAFFALSGMWAVTVSKHLAVAKDDAKANDGYLRQHEYVHMRQFRRYGWFGFVVRYLAQCFRYGYANAPFEVEARETARLWREAQRRARTGEPRLPMAETSGSRRVASAGLTGASE